MNHELKRTLTQGFTLIELVLAMAFISVLLLTIAMTVIQMSATFNKGMGVKEVNQTARDIDTDLRRTFAAVEPLNLSTGGGQLIKTDAGGRLCLGAYSYIWNTEDALTSGNSELVKYSGDGVVNPNKTPTTKIRFLKVPDMAKKYCSVTPDGAIALREISQPDAKLSTELIEAGDRKLGIQAFDITTSNSARDSATGQQLYSVDYVLGTGDVSAMNDDRTQCLESGENADPAFCHVEQFDLVIRAGIGG